MASSFEAKFNVKGLPKPLTVITSRITFSQPVSPKGRPTAGVRSGQIVVRLLGDDRGTITDWAMDPLKALSGEIVYYDPVTKTVFRKLNFKDTYCVRYNEIFTVGDGVAAYTFELGLTAREMHLDDKLHDNMWSNWKAGE